MLHSVRWILWLIPAIHLIYSFEGKLKRFDKKIQCFFIDRNTGRLYVKTPDEIVDLNEDLVPISSTKPVSDENLTINGTDAYACRNAKPTALTRECTLESGNYLTTNTPRQTVSTRETALSCTLGLVIYAFPAGENTYSIITVKGHANNSVESRLLRQRNAENCSADSEYALYCKVPRPNTNASFTYFTKASTAVLTAKQNGSYSLFVAFEKYIGSRRFSVVCEYGLFTDICLHNKVSERAIPSAVWSSESNVTTLLPMHLENSAILIVGEKDRIGMLWLPLVNNTDKPQTVFSLPFDQENDGYSDLDEVEVTGILPNRNTTGIYVTTDHAIFGVKLDKCSSYANCTECIVSAPSYCGWCSDQNRCTFERLCSRQSQQSRTKTWLENAISNETVCNKQHTTARFHNSWSTDWLQPTVYVSTRPTKKAKSLHRDERLTTFPSWRDLSVEKALPAKHTADRVVETILWISVALAVVIVVLVAVICVIYIRIKNETKATSDGFKRNYLHCEGIGSYRKLKGVLWSQSTQSPYARQIPFNEKDEDSDASVET